MSLPMLVGLRSLNARGAGSNIRTVLLMVGDLANNTPL